VSRPFGITSSDQRRAYTKVLFDKGKIVLAGFAMDGAIGIIVWRGESAEERTGIFPSIRNR
jgi:hypothetical protein